MMSSRKRDINGRTKTEEKILDRFSTLPEALIIRILSLLEMKDVVKTSILAKSWRYIWTQVYNIVLRHGFEQINFILLHHIKNGEGDLSLDKPMEIREIREKRWLSSVDHALTKCIATDINRFCLIGFCQSYSVINKWILFALDRNVKIMELSEFYDVPERLFQSSSITTLELCDVSGICLPSRVNLSSLKSLRLENPTLDEASLEKILRGSPVLENLVLDKVSNLCNINIMSPTVKRFKLDWLEDDEEPTKYLKIRAPWLQELELSAEFVTSQCKLTDVSSLTKATLTIMFKPEEEVAEYEYEVAEINNKWISMMTKLLDSMSYVGELKIGSPSLQVLPLFKLRCTPSPLFKCKHLSIETYLWKLDIPGIVWLLENAPHLETVLIKVLDDRQDAFSFSKTKNYFGDSDLHLGIPNGKLLHLKNVTIDYQHNPCSDDTESSYGDCSDDTESNYGECFDFELVEYILRSVVILEKLVLCSSSGRCRYECPEPNRAFRYVPRLSSKLIATFLGGNEVAAEWELKKSKNKFVFTF